MNRREFTSLSLKASASLGLINYSKLYAKTHGEELIFGHGDFRYKLDTDWCLGNNSVAPVLNCHEMVIDKQGRLIFVTDNTKNNVIIMDRAGKIIKTWGTSYLGAHGLTINNEGGEEFLYISDSKQAQVVKTTIDGREILRITTPYFYKRKEKQIFRPTETAIGPNGDIYIADGYGLSYIIRYDSKGNYISHFGGKGLEDHSLDVAHGVCIDNRDINNPTLLCTSRNQNSFKRFTLDGQYLNTIFLPGAYVCRPVIDEENIYSGVCWSRLKYLNQTPESGFVTILDGSDKVVSNVGGTKPKYENGKLQLMVQKQNIFKHCHDVCIDSNKDIYVCQWNANGMYPTRLIRV